MIEIPLNSNPEQLFSVVLEGEIYECRVVYNSRKDTWTISFAQNGEDIITGINLLGGVDILEQYTLPIENMYVVNLDDSSLDATADNLGTVSKLFLLTEEEVSDV